MVKRSSQKWRGAIIAYAPLFIWIGVIFFLSRPDASMAETSRIIGPLLRYLFPDASPETLQMVHKGVRKSAHIVEYAVLAFLAVRCLSMSVGTALRGWRYIIPVGLVAAIASLDEYNQSLDVRRTGTFDDTLLDIASGSVMLALLWMINRPRIKTPESKPDAESQDQP